MEVRYLVPQNALSTQQPFTLPSFSFLKEPAEVLSLSNLTLKLLQRKKKSMKEGLFIGYNLERYWSLKHNVDLHQPIAIPPRPKLFNFNYPPILISTVETTSNREKNKRKLP